MRYLLLFRKSREAFYTVVFQCQSKKMLNYSGMKGFIVEIGSL